MKEIMETLFNIVYLVTLWIVVFNMFKNTARLNSKETKLGKLVAWTFALLAIGDTGHVGFRVVAYFKDGLAESAALLGYGKYATAITVTFFYVLLLIIWKVRFNEKYNCFTHILFASGIVRLVVVLLPGNEWTSAVAPFDWAIYRNIPLLILGLGVAGLFLNSARKEKDNTFKWIGIMILISYGFYIPVILFAHINPTVGMLMIPKTVAYLVAAFIAYYGVFKKQNKNIQA
ncbi:hypothetical protein [Oceanirhabdus sp. W0125-5]|uniref:hypothetical protein n=1 Tax=Oceanirhabdus sp. W0125-5 TaxID=2999116 RepID=UPI0022F2D62E|nr:hypothetical protein [Oceanirhabdus sp. W0125-5]WBW96791.1 hypothetical protein OW730_24330 [Oceanirhabdus sp. W0125-5]